MKNRILLFFILLFSASSFAQNDNSKINPKAIETYNRAMVRTQDDSFDEAIRLFKEAIRLDTNYVDAYLSLAGVYGDKKDYENSIPKYML